MPDVLVAVAVVLFVIGMAGVAYHVRRDRRARRRRDEERRR
jgi:membrane protein required for beta-lactamase induction